jgi:hypothetical protein
LNKLEGSTGTITLLFGKFVPFIQTAFAVFLLDRHGGVVKVKGEGESIAWKRLGLGKIPLPILKHQKTPRETRNFATELSDKRSHVEIKEL